MPALAPAVSTLQPLAAATAATVGASPATFQTVDTNGAHMVEGSPPPRRSLSNSDVPGGVGGQAVFALLEHGLPPHARVAKGSSKRKKSGGKS